MLIDFFFTLRAFAVKTSLRELLDLLNALNQRVVAYNIDDFYQLARIVLIKDESQYDKFDRAFAQYFQGIDGDLNLEQLLAQDLPPEWLEKLAEKFLSAEEREKIKALGGFEELMKTLQQRLNEQHERHQGGNKWIGTAGTSPFGAYGYNPEGVRIGQHQSRHRRAVKVWDQREFANFDDGVSLGNRNIKLALKRLRKFARSGNAHILDLPDTIRATANNAGMLDIKMQRERHNAVKILLFMDVGGSMDDYIRQIGELFSACRSEFKHLEYFYFHNCIYEQLWQDNARRHSERTAFADILHTYGEDYKIIIVGDASMSPYEILYPGGSVEHWNEVAGAAYLQQLVERFPKLAWLNPVAADDWQYVHSINIIQNIIGSRMYPLTLAGLDDAIRNL